MKKKNWFLKFVCGLSILGLVATFSFSLSLPAKDAEEGSGAKGSISAGQNIFEANCAMCHYADKSGTKIGPGLKDLTKNKELPSSHRPSTEANIREAIQKGRPDGQPMPMPPFGERLSAEEMQDLMAYLGEQSAGAPAAQAASASRPSLDYEFFKTRVEPIFLKKRSADHARCYVCHQISHHGGEGGPFSLEELSPGSSFWTEEQSRRNFETVSKLVIPGAPLSSLFLLMPLAPEAGGAEDHSGGRQFASQDDPDWKAMAAWVRGEKVEGSSAP